MSRSPISQATRVAALVVRNESAQGERKSQIPSSKMIHSVANLRGWDSDTRAAAIASTPTNQASVVKAVQESTPKIYGAKRRVAPHAIVTQSCRRIHVFMSNASLSFLSYVMARSLNTQPDMINSQAGRPLDCNECADHRRRRRTPLVSRIPAEQEIRGISCYAPIPVSHPLTRLRVSGV